MQRATRRRYTDDIKAQARAIALGWHDMFVPFRKNSHFHELTAALVDFVKPMPFHTIHNA